MTTHETAIKRIVDEELAEHVDICLHSNPVGQAYVHNAAGDLYPINIGLGPGTLDKVGFRTVTITPAMVGLKLAIYLEIECKSIKGKVTELQRNRLNTITRAGGIALVARGRSDVHFLREEKQCQLYLMRSNCGTPQGAPLKRKRNTLKPSALPTLKAPKLPPNGPRI